MSRTVKHRIERLEAAPWAASGPFVRDIPTLTPSEFAAALAAAAPVAKKETGAVVIALDAWTPPEAAEAVEQARALMQTAFDLGFARLGHHNDPARYLTAALPEMFPEPRSPAAARMVEALVEGALPVIRYIVKPAEDGRPVAEGWKP